MKCCERFLTGIVFFVLASTVANAHPISCTGKIYNGPKVAVTANWASITTLTNISLLYDSENKSKNLKEVSADPHYNPRSSVYMDYNRFELNDDGWSTIYILLPKELPHTSEFVAYVMDAGHGGLGTARMLCSQRRQ